MSSTLSRRSVIQLAGAALAMPLVSQASASGAQAAPKAAAAPKPLPLKIGVASYSLRKFPRDKAIAALVDLRVKYVTIKDVHLARTDSPEQIRAAREQFEDAGITIMGGGTLTWKTPDEAAMRKDFEYAKLAGMPLVVCSPAPDTLDLLEKMVKEYDIKAAIHNHGTEDPWWPAPSAGAGPVDEPWCPCRATPRGSCSSIADSCGPARGGWLPAATAAGSQCTGARHCARDSECGSSARPAPHSRDASSASAPGCHPAARCYRSDNARSFLRPWCRREGGARA